MYPKYHVVCSFSPQISHVPASRAHATSSDWITRESVILKTLEEANEADLIDNITVYGKKNC